VGVFGHEFAVVAVELIVGGPAGVAVAALVESDDVVAVAEY
jgi:hypothetical protein